MGQTSRKRRSSRIYTEGELNALIDAIVHPLAKSSPYVMLIDGLLHALVEKNPSESTLKFIKYNLPKLLEQMARDASERR
jgi:hypothetical protein